MGDTKLSSEDENINNNPLVIPLDTEANMTAQQSHPDNQGSESHTKTNTQISNENTEVASPISTDSTTSPSQGASSTQESLSELSSVPRQSSLECNEADNLNISRAGNKSESTEGFLSDAQDDQKITDNSETKSESINQVVETVSENPGPHSSSSSSHQPPSVRLKYSPQNLGADVKSDIENLVAQADQIRASQGSPLGTTLGDQNSRMAHLSSSRLPNQVDNDTVPTNCDTTSSPVCGEDTPDSVDKDIYHVKWIEFGLRNCAIITQNENGPCPLISIVNVLLLRGRLSLPPETEMVSAEQLLEYLGDMVLSQASPDNQDPDLQRNLNDAVAVLNRLATGLDVNVKFTGVSDFEFTPEMLIFDILNIDLFHGWLVDPQAEDVALAVNGYSYNQLVETIISNRQSGNSEKLSQSLLAAQFLEESAAQLTYHGLYELTSKLQDQCLAVFFRNNHFSTIFKKNGELFLLVTDQGYLNQSDVVWETLANIEGDCHFVNHLFQTSGVDERLQGKDLPEDSIERDRYLAETLQREVDVASQRESLFQEFKNKHFGGGNEMSDEELAKRLQEVENRAAQEMDRRNQNQNQGGSSAPPPQNPIGPRSNKKNKDCTIL